MGSINLDPDQRFDHRQTAADWHGGQRTPLYAYASTGTVLRGLDSEIRDCLAIVERRAISRDADPVTEHERLVALLHHIEADVAVQEASDIGRQHGESAAAWWQQDALGGRATGDAAATARHVLKGMNDGDPAVLGALPGPIDGYTTAELEDDCDWREPDLDDQAAHARWQAARSGLWDAYQTAFQQALHEAVIESCQHELVDPTALTARPVGAGAEPAGSVPREVSERHLAQARHRGAEVAVADAAALTLTEREAQGVFGGWHEVDPPALSNEWDASPTAHGLASEIIDFDVLVRARVDTLVAIESAVAGAWDEGRDTVWDDAVRATAARALGCMAEARHIDNLLDRRVRTLSAAASAAPAETGRDLRTSDGSRGHWTRDRVTAARSALDRSEQLAIGLDTSSRAPGTPEPTRGLEL